MEMIPRLHVSAFVVRIFGTIEFKQSKASSANVTIGKWENVLFTWLPVGWVYNKLTHYRWYTSLAVSAAFCGGKASVSHADLSRH